MSEQANDRWLSTGAEVLIDEVERDPDAWHCEVLIVGSGYGGAVAAAHLAGATPVAGGDPVKVYVIERGNEYLPGEFPATFAEIPGHVRFSKQDGKPSRGRLTGLFDLRLGKVSVVLGNGLGGGSLINAAVMEEASEDAFMDARWPKDLRRPDALKAHYDAARSMLKPEQMPGSVPKLDSLMEAGEAMGAYGERKAWLAVAFHDGTSPAGVATRACIKCGDCVSGCNYRAKKSLDANYLAMAKANDAELFCGATVHRLRAVDEGYAVDFFLTDPDEARADRERCYTLKARRVILAAGSLGSTEILLRSQGEHLPIGGSGLGQCFSTNGDLIAVAHRQKPVAHACAKEGDAPDRRNVGPTITGLLRKKNRKDPRPLVIEEFGIPAPLRRAFAEVVTTSAALHDLPHADSRFHKENEVMDDPLAVSDQALEHSAVYGMMGDDGANGVIEFKTAADVPMCDAQVCISWDGVGDLPVFNRQMDALRKAHGEFFGLGGRVLPNPLWQPLPDLGPLGAKIGATTVHPLGGCPMADSASGGVVDQYGRVFAKAGAKTPEMPGLAVLDGSIVPVALGINPALTIAALAERAIPVLAKDWKLVPRGSSKPQTVPRPVRRDRNHPTAPLPTRVAIGERLRGDDIRIDGKSFALEAVAEFAPVAVPDLRRLPRTVSQPRVMLRFIDAAGKVSAAICRGQVKLLVRESSDREDRMLRVLGLVRRKLAALGIGTSPATEYILGNLCTHFGEARLIRYEWTVIDTQGAPLVSKGQTMHFTKRLALTEGANPWRQLSEGDLDMGSHNGGRLRLDLNYFVEQMTPLLKISAQQDEPNALGDLAELGLWVLRVALNIHLVSFLPPTDGLKNNGKHRLPGNVDGVDPVGNEVPHPESRTFKPGETPPVRKLSRYIPKAGASGARPVLLIHGYGASGSTFAHACIPNNLVSTLMKAGRDVWVLDLRTSIGLCQRDYWSFDEVARADIPDAVKHVLEQSGAQQLDVVAHCIGAAMFCVEMLRNEDKLYESIGAVVLSQVGPLLRASPMNRFRAYLASYLQQYIGVEQFDVLPNEQTAAVLLADAVLATFPYPDGDGEAKRLLTVPGFAAVRHRADGIFGQTMRLDNIGDPMLLSLADIYGWVMVKGLAQVSHYAREQLLTDAQGMNRVVTHKHLAERFAFPVMLLHGRQNAVFDWRGSWDSYALLRAVFGNKKKQWREAPPNDRGDMVFGEGTRRRLVVLDAYGHQDCLIGEHAGKEVFPRLVNFLDEFRNLQPGAPNAEEPELRAELPWKGPVLGRVGPADGGNLLRCRLAVLPPPARATTLAVVYVPLRRTEAGLCFCFDEMVGHESSNDELRCDALEVILVASKLPDYVGFAVVTVHNDLPLLRKIDVSIWSEVDFLFRFPNRAPSGETRRKVIDLLQPACTDHLACDIDASVVRLDSAWIAAAMKTSGAPSALSFALASCQYPQGLFDAAPAQRSCERLVQHLDSAPAGERAQLLLLVGDQVYVDETAGLFQPSSVNAVEHAYFHGFRLEAWRAATRRLPTYPMLDDRELGNNWEPGSLPSALENAGLCAYRRHQHKWAEDPSVIELNYSIKAAGRLFNVLDTRSRRQQRVLRPTAGAKLLGDALIHDALDATRTAQLLKDLPADSPAFIVSSVALLPLPRRALFAQPSERLGLDDWSGYPRSQFDLLEILRDGPARQVILLAGDRHMSSVSSLWMKGAGGTVEVISIVSSGLYAPWPFANSRPEEFWLDGPVSMSFEGRRIEGQAVTAAAGTSDGYALVRVEPEKSGGWTLHVTLDLAEGRIVCRRPLGGVDPHAVWTIDGFEGGPRTKTFDIRTLPAASSAHAAASAAPESSSGG
ncbi:GMC family oxidoreductase N-terminal domain-containing protein [Variovorax paradoxus]|nr:alpha/beta fold hydrolase [Variovorax paradoxus]MBT2301535.1 GMC family oxidoreductase N-terminal domain-containing protein [Variovorax paradoxus]